ncbi:MAG: hypothetical protein JWN74_3167 [Acidobacteriaceae bacterium]|nr:hypothetical protein [Acidobacteriaceae bacterium]
MAGRGNRVVVRDVELTAMIVTISTSGLKRTEWWEYLLRFILGGLVTAIAGLIAKKFGPSFGGLFLAFPAILASSATMVEKHERERKKEKWMSGVIRGRQAAGADAAGAAMGSIGLIAFAACVWKLLPEHNPWLVIGGATLLWAVVATAGWFLWKRKVLHRLRTAKQE